MLNAAISAAESEYFRKTSISGRITFKHASKTNTNNQNQIKSQSKRLTKQQQQQQQQRKQQDSHKGNHSTR